MSIFNNTEDFMKLILQKMSDRDNSLLDQIKDYHETERVRLDGLVHSIASLEKDVAKLSLTVSSNHLVAISHIDSKKSEIREEMSEKYASKEDLSKGLNAVRKDLENKYASIKNTAKLIWSTVGTLAALGIWLSTKGVL